MVMVFLSLEASKTTALYINASSIGGICMVSSISHCLFYPVWYQADVHRRSYLYK